MSGKAAFGAWPMRGFSVASVRWPVRDRPSAMPLAYADDVHLD